MPDPDEPDLSDVVILSLALGVDAQQTVSWTEAEDGRFYGRMEVLRSKMPTKREDFDLKVPDDVEILSIAKQVQAYALVHPLGAFVDALSSDDAYGVAVAHDAAVREGSQSDFWDITLRHRDNPSLQKTYTLEVVPVEAGKPTPMPDPNPTPTPMPEPTPNPNPGYSPTPTAPYVPTANDGLGSDAGLADTGDNAMDGVLAFGLLGVCFGVLALAFGLIARSRRT